MKHIWLILFLILTAQVAFCQTIVPRSNSSITVQDARFSAQYNLFVPRYADTTAANLSTNEGIDTLGAIIFTYDNMSLMVRKIDGGGKEWVAVGGAGTVTEVTGTANQISVATGTTTPVISLATGGTLPGAWALGTPISGTLTNATGLPIVGGTTGTLTIARGGTNLTTLGTDGQLLRVNTGATALEYFTPTYATDNIYTADGTLTGDRVVDLNGNDLTIANASNIEILLASSTNELIFTGDTIRNHGQVVIGNIGDSYALYFVGQTSGAIGIQPAAEAGTYTLTLPTTDGDADQFLQTNGSGVLTWATASGGNTIYTGDGTLAGDRTITLSSNFLKTVQGSDEWLVLDPDNGGALIRGFNGTNSAKFEGAGGVADAAFEVFADFDNGTKRGSIVGFADASTSSITLTADAILLVDGTAAAGYVWTSTDGTGLGSWQPSGGGASLFPITGTGTATGNVIGELDGNTLEVQEDGNRLLELDPVNNVFYFGGSIANSGTQTGVTINNLTGEITLANNTADAGIYINADANTILLDVNTQTIIELDGNTQTILYDAVGGHTFIGNILTQTDNTYDIGDATNSFKDIYSRTLILDGSTSGTVTLASDAVAKSFRATTLTGEGYVSSNSITIQQSAESLADDNSIQPVFSSGQDVYTVQGSTLYEMEGYYDVSSGATSHSTLIGLVLAGGASINWIKYNSAAYQAAIDVTTNAGRWVSIDQIAATAINAAGVQTRWFIYFKGFVSINAAGTVTPSIQFSVQTNGTCEIGIGSYFKLTPVGVNSTASVGPIN